MAIEFKDYYQTLGVSKTASKDEIRKAFRKLAREYHPDIAKDKQVAEEKFKEINEAYEVLGDPDKRAKYDSLGPDWKSGIPHGRAHRRGRGSRGGGVEGFEFQFGGTGFSDFFEQFFGGGGGSPFAGGGGGFHNGPVPGRNIEADLQVTLHEAMLGSTRPITLRSTAPCPTCQGQGLVERKPCPSCRGQGVVEQTESYQVKIPAGVRDRQRLRLAGKGESGSAHGPKGDLLLRVRLVKHPDFVVEDADLIHELTLAPWEAVLGGQASLPTLDGHLTIKVPPGSQTGQRLRVRGRGLVRSGTERGDLLVTLRVQVPPTVTDEEQKLWERLRDASSFRPRDGG